MKKTLPFIILLLVSFITSCDEEKTEFTSFKPISIKKATGEYYGDKQGKGIATFTLNLISGKTNSENQIQGEGFSLNIEFYSNLAVDPDNAIPTNGTYTISNEESASTIAPGIYDTENDSITGTYCQYSDKSNNISKVIIDEGSFTINKNGDTYIIETNFKDQEGNEIKAKYEGALTFTNKEIEELPDPIILNAARGYYWGDDLIPGIGEYSILLISGKDVGGELSGLGYEVGITCYSDLSRTPWDAIVPTHKYEVNQSKEIYSLLAADPVVGGSYYSVTYLKHNFKDENGIEQSNMYYVTGGSMNVTYPNGKYVLNINFILDNGETFTAKYEGGIKFSDEYSVTTLRSDLNVSDFEGGQLIYTGKDKYSNFDIWKIYLFGNGLGIGEGGDLTGKGKFFHLEFSTNTSHGSTFPEGEYDVRINKGDMVAIATDHTVYKYLGAFHSIYLDYDMSKEEPLMGVAPFVSGKVSVNKSGDNYILNMSFYDEAKNHITGTYSGSLYFFDQTANAAKNTIKHSIWEKNIPTYQTINNNKIPAIKKAKIALRKNR